MYLYSAAAAAAAVTHSLTPPPQLDERRDALTQLEREADSKQKSVERLEAIIAKRSAQLTDLDTQLDREISRRQRELEVLPLPPQPSYSFLLGLMFPNRLVQYLL